MHTFLCFYENMFEGLVDLLQNTLGVPSNVNATMKYKGGEGKKGLKKYLHHLCSISICIFKLQQQSGMLYVKKYY